jgi:hypothetical protein
VQQNTGGGLAPVSGAPVTVTLANSNGAVASPAGPFTGTTDANGHFFVTFTSATAGQVIGTATTTITVGGVQVTRSTDGSAGNSGPATKTFVDANISITPSATNEVSHNHTFTVTVLQNAGTGAGFVAAAGATVTVSLTNQNGAVASPAGPITGTTDVGGHFLVTFTSATAGQVVGNASTTISVGGASLTRATGDSHAGDSGPATKTFVDATISITPSTATNAVNQNHTFTVTVLQNAGTGGGFVAAAGAPVTVTLTNHFGAVASPAGPFTGTTDANGHFFVTFTSATAGQVTGSASTMVSVGGISLSRATGDSHAGDSGPATKTFVDAKISITPSATNEVNHNHTFTVTVLQNNGTGSGFVAAPGATVTVSLTNQNGAVASPAGPFTGSTDANGRFSVTFTSAKAGQVIGNASTTVSVGGVSLTRATGDSNAGDGGPATKTFVDARISITPTTATNPIGTPHTLTVTVQQNAGQGAGFAAAPDGTVVHLSIINGAATFVATGTQTQDVTLTGGSATAVINSSTAGNNVIHAATTFSVGGVSLTRATGDGLPGDSPNATKLYVAGSLCWLKEDNQGSLLGGATFLVTGPSYPNGVTVVDNSPPDQDPAAGKFMLNNLALGTYTIQETAAPDGFNLDPTIASVTLTASNPSNCDNTTGDVVPVFVDTPSQPMFRMTGGGSIFLPAGAIPGQGVRVTHGFELHCNTDANNHLEINWGQPNNHFHLLQLTSVTCLDDPNINPAPPPSTANLGDTMIGEGTGRFSGTVNGVKYHNVTATVDFKFTDAGEPGTNDTASYKITLSDGTVVLDSLGSVNLTFGNHQVHAELKNLTPAATKVRGQLNKTFNALDNQNLNQSKLDNLTQDLLAQFTAFEAAQSGATISGVAFLDADHDGIQELGEGLVANVVVQLFDSSGKKVGQTKTDITGQYQFNAAPGSYYVKFVLPSNSYHFSPQYQGGDPTVDSDVDASGKTALFSVLAGEIDDFLSAGLYSS